MCEGFTNGDHACCGKGRLDAGFLCHRFEPLCSNDSEYVFWDSFHPTEATYRKLVAPILQKYMSQFV